MNSRVMPKFFRPQPQPDFCLVALCDLKIVGRPFLFVMAVLGLLKYSDESEKKSWRTCCWQASSILLFLLFWAYIIGRFTYLTPPQFGFSLAAIQSMLDIAWNISIAIFFIGYFLANRRNSDFRLFFHLWKQIKIAEHVQDGLEKKLKRNSWIIACAGVLAAMTRCTMYLNWAYSSATSKIIGEWWMPYKTGIIVYCIVVELFSCTFVIWMCIMLTSLYLALDIFLKDSLRFGVIMLEEFRSAYHIAVELGAVAERTLHLFLGAIIVPNTLNICGETYFVVVQFFTVTVTIEDFLLNLVYLPVGIGVILFVGWMASDVHAKATISRKALSSIPLITLRVSEQMQVLSLQTRLSNSSSVGLSIFGMITVTKGFIPSIISGFASYTFLLIQLHRWNGEH